MIAFISGHLDVTRDEFNTHYKPKILEALHQHDSFVIGDARGADVMAQEYLYNMIIVEKVNIVIYHMFYSPRNNIGNYDTVGGFKSDDERDAAMTAASDYDIAWVRPGKEKSGTAKNIKRRINKI